jgi:PilZ domain
MLDRRKVHRGRSYLGGQIVFNNRFSTLDCLVKNFSEAGAKIVFCDPVEIPGEFDLTIHQKNHNRHARVVWRTETEAGVAFAPSLSSIVVSIEAARKIRKLEAERDALAQRVARLSEPQ